MRHGPVRVWFAPWKKRCRCGCRWYPCPDAAYIQPPPVVVSLRGGTTNTLWTAPTGHYPIVRRNERPLMTRAQEYRTRRNG